MSDVLLSVENLTKYFSLKAGLIFDKTKAVVKAVDGVSFEVREGETFGLVGESGCGKTTIAKLLLLLEPLTDGIIKYKNRDILNLSKKELSEYRFAIQAVFQDPYSSLNPRMRARDIISEPMSIAGKESRKVQYGRVEELLDIVGLMPDTAMMYPHEFSGGQRQRIAVARALSVQPKIIILDEPVSALDVSLQAQILNLLEAIQNDFGLTYLIISHDLAVVEHIADVIGVMYLGEIVERLPASQLWENALHPYARALLAAVPIPDPDIEFSDEVLGGEVPSPINPPSGCRFHPRCAKAEPSCAKEKPQLCEIKPDHWVSCHLV